MTLLFLGATPADRLVDLERAATETTGQGFDMALDHVAGWKYNRIGYAAPARPDEKLGRLAASLRERIAAAGFEFDDRKFTPHVTLLRKTERVLQSQQVVPVDWRVRDFVLVQSAEENGAVRYRILRRWPLD